MEQIIHGDSFELIRDVLEDARDPIIVTDPPFNIGYHYRSYNDRKNEAEYFRDIAEMFRHCPSVVTLYPEALHRLSIEMGEAPERVISWVYPSNTRRQHRDIAFYRVKPDMRKVRQPYRNMNDKRVRALYERTGGAALYDWVECNQVKNVSEEKTAHPCQMPLDLMRKIVGILPDDATVIDPFAGSGTTLVAAKELGRDCIGIEIDEAYIDIIEERLD